MIKIYGHDGTIHGTNYVDVEVDENGNVVSVWFRCMTLSFRQTNVNSQRANSMRETYKDKRYIAKLVAVEYEDDEEGLMDRSKEYDDEYHKRTIDNLERQLTTHKTLLKDICDDMDCLPKCDSFDHEELCPVVNPNAAWRTLRNQLADLRGLVVVANRGWKDKPLDWAKQATNVLQDTTVQDDKV